MEKTILIPIDFNIESLNTLKLAMRSNREDKIRVVLMYAVSLDNSITDLLFYSENNLIKKLMTSHFNEALLILKNSFGTQLSDCRIKLYHGQTSAAFRSFLEANNITEIYLPKKYSLRLTGYAFDTTRLIKNCGLPFYEIDWSSKSQGAEGDQLSNLFSL